MSQLMQGDAFSIMHGSKKKPIRCTDAFGHEKIGHKRTTTFYFMLYSLLLEPFLLIGMLLDEWGDMHSPGDPLLKDDSITCIETKCTFHTNSNQT